MSKSKRYRVIGRHAVDGHLPGDTYSAAYSDEHEMYLIQAGHVEPVGAKATDNPPDEGDNTPEEGDA
jgi:hypothetical protein